MTYTVKNGTWCKDNDKEYYSTTKTGLKAALKAGEITAGTKVVVHEPKYHPGQLIQSLNPNCPEGCFIPDGSAFDMSVYTDLAVIFPDGNLPDIRECVMVCAGRNEHITTHSHDVFSAGEFKDDQAQLVEHDHDITDPGHGHTVTDPGHVHTVTDPGHKHSNTVPGYAESGKNYNHIANGGDDLEETLVWNTDSATTGISVNSNTTGVSVNSRETGIIVNAKGNDSVTRTKQFGVYYYIAF